MPGRSASAGRSLHIAACIAAVAMLITVAPLTSSSDKDKPAINVRASPSVAFAPKRVVLTAELKGGPNDYEQFYCATIEWDIIAMGGFGDGSKSEQKLECDPFEPGKSEIKRVFVRDQLFKSAGDYRVQFNLKQKNKVVGSGRTTIKIRPGAGDIMDQGIR